MATTRRTTSRRRHPTIRALDRSYADLREMKGTELSFQTIDLKGAHAMGIGRKQVGGKLTGQLALRFYVSKKQPASRLGADERVPDRLRFTSRKGTRTVELATDIIESEPAQFEPFDPEARHRPVPGGVSGGIPGHTGTIGGWVWDETDDTIVMLSNDHVFGHDAGDDIIQQGSADGGSSPGDKIGDVKRGIPRVNSPAVNQVDCAIGDPDDSGIYNLSVHDIGPAVYATAVGSMDMEVEKYGQTTEHTYGEIQDTDWSGSVSGKLFEDCLYVDIIPPSTDWSAGGDSGSLVFSQTPIETGSTIKPVVGLHFAGGGTHGIECKIQSVFDRLDLTTLCAGAFSVFLDSLFETEEEGEVSAKSEARLRTLAGLATRSVSHFTPMPFAAKERRKLSAGRFHAGISRDVQKRLAGSRRGALVTKFVDSYRGELLTMLVRDGDIRRSTVATLGPLVAGATTTTDLLERKLTERDVRRLVLLSKEVGRKGSRSLNARMRTLVALSRGATGKNLAQILQIPL